MQAVRLDPFGRAVGGRLDHRAPDLNTAPERQGDEERIPAAGDKAPGGREGEGRHRHVHGRRNRGHPGLRAHPRATRPVGGQGDGDAVVFAQQLDRLGRRRGAALALERLARIAGAAAHRGDAEASHAVGDDVAVAVGRDHRVHAPAGGHLGRNDQQAAVPDRDHDPLLLGADAVAQRGVGDLPRGGAVDQADVPGAQRGGEPAQARRAADPAQHRGAQPSSSVGLASRSSSRRRCRWAMK